MKPSEFLLSDLSATARWGGALARALVLQPLPEQAFVIHLSGDLGAGKTEIVRSILRGFGFSGAVKSPTFTLLEPYNLPSFPIYHFDLYRFSTPDQWFDAGFDDTLAGPGLMLLEWPEKALGALARPDLAVRVDVTGRGDERRLVVIAGSGAGQRCLTDLRRELGDGTC